MQRFIFNFYYRSLLLFSLLSCLCAISSSVWPPADWLLHSLLSSVPSHLSRFDSASGRFQPSGWQVRHQQVIFPLAVAWSYAAVDNPYHADATLLAIISQAGATLADAQDSQGRWPATTGERTMTFQAVCNRWIKTYLIIQKQLPPEAQAKWQSGLLKSFQTIADEMRQASTGTMDLSAAGLYAAGQCLNKKDWCELAQNKIKRILTMQTAEGFWRAANAEQNTPHLLMTLMHMDTLGFYYAQTKDQNVLKALERAARWHLTLVWPDGTMPAAFDNTMPYRKTRNLGNLGFSWTAAGRTFLLKQTAAKHHGQLLDADYAANMLQFGGSGTGETKIAANFTSLDQQVRKQQLGTWHICLSAYTAPDSPQRWILDRQNHLDVFHEQLGAIVSGNGKNQPQWSNFNFPETEASNNIKNAKLVPDAKGAKQDSGPEKIASSRWLATAAKITSSKHTAGMELIYGQDRAQITLKNRKDGRLVATYSLPGESLSPAIAHLPLLRRSGYIHLGNGELWYPDTTSRQISGRAAGGWLFWDGLRIDFPEEAELLWPSLPTPTSHAIIPDRCRLVISLPLSASRRQQQVIFAAQSLLPPAALSFSALQLPVISPTATAILKQDSPGAVLLCATAPGEAMTFTMSVPESGTYELLADLMLGNDHGTMQLAVNDQVLEATFDTYAPQLDFSGPMSLGKLPLTKGKKQVKVTVLEKNSNAGKYLAGVKSFFLLKQ